MYLVFSKPKKKFLVLHQCEHWRKKDFRTNCILVQTFSQKLFLANLFSRDVKYFCFLVCKDLNRRAKRHSTMNRWALVGSGYARACNSVLQMPCETLGLTDYKTQLAIVAFGTGATDSSVFELGLNSSSMISRDRRPHSILDHCFFRARNASGTYVCIH